MIVQNDYKQLSAVKRYKGLNILSLNLDNFISLALEICEASVAVISLVDDNEEIFLASSGTDKQRTSLSKSFSLHNLHHDPVLTISDVANHKRFSNTDLSTVAPHMRFYAGAILISPAGDIVGRLYVLGHKPKQLIKRQENCLQFLAMQVMKYLEQQITLQWLQQQVNQTCEQGCSVSESGILQQDV